MFLPPPPLPLLCRHLCHHLRHRGCIRFHHHREHCNRNSPKACGECGCQDSATWRYKGKSGKDCDWCVPARAARFAGPPAPSAPHIPMLYYITPTLNPEGLRMTPTAAVRRSRATASRPKTPARSLARSASGVSVQGKRLSVRHSPKSPRSRGVSVQGERLSVRHSPKSPPCPRALLKGHVVLWRRTCVRPAFLSSAGTTYAGMTHLTHTGGFVR